MSTKKSHILKQTCSFSIYVYDSDDTDITSYTDDKPCFNNEEKSECRKDHYKDNTGSIFIVVLELVFT